jgi:Signal peptidase (SPase) II
VGLILVAAWSVRTTSHAVAIGLLLGGGIGNLLDRLLRAPGPLRGGVVDWIKPTLSSGSLNLADLAINAAVITILVGLAIDWLRQRRDRSGGDPAPAQSLGVATPSTRGRSTWIPVSSVPAALGRCGGYAGPAGTSRKHASPTEPLEIAVRTVTTRPCAYAICCLHSSGLADSRPDRSGHSAVASADQGSADTAAGASGCPA